MDEQLQRLPWRVWFTSRRAASEADSDIAAWLDSRSTPDGRPFLVGPDGTYDPDLNGYFEALPLVAASPHTQDATARDLARFFTFLYWSRWSDESRPASSAVWRAATPADRAAYYHWRNVDLEGPRVSASTWNREVATVSGFYQWAVSKHLVEASPIELREARYRGRGRHQPGSPDTARELRPDRSARALTWMPASEYRHWRDVGLRGFLPEGRRDTTFRGTLAGRNTAFADLMMRTGLRLTEQASLLATELPERASGARFRKFWLPAAIAKNKSARDVYVPDQVLGALGAYRTERQSFVETARAAGTYDSVENMLVTNERAATARNRNGALFKVDALTPAERHRLYVETADGLEPAMLWVSEDGRPLSANSWQNVFAAANRRCARLGVDVRCHPHALRHTYAVRTLEQLQRGHLQALAANTSAQRRHYTMIFGDPLNWVRLRLGHRSVETTAIYLHTLAELEFESRLALVGEDDEWTVPGEEEEN